VFGHDHRAEDIAERIDHLMTAVFVADDTDRLQRLTRHLPSDFVYVSPQAVFEGAAGLSETFARLRHEPHRHTSRRRTSPVDLHHGYFRYSWARSERGVDCARGLELRLARRRGVDLPGGHLRGIGARPNGRPIMRRSTPSGREC